MSIVTESKIAVPAAPFDQEQIKLLIPHREPFLFVHRVLQYDLDEKNITAEYKLSADDDFFQGHFPAQKIMPGVLMIEGAAQSACILAMLNNLHNDGERTDNGYLPFLVAIRNAKFRHTAEPGNTLKYVVRQVRQKMMFIMFAAEIYVADEMIASVELTSHHEH